MIDMKKDFDICEIEDFAQRARKFTIPQVQAEFGLSYAKARAAVDEMTARKLVRFEGGLTFAWKSGKPSAFDEVQSVVRRAELRRDFKRLRSLMGGEEQSGNRLMLQRADDDGSFSDSRAIKDDGRYPDNALSETFAYALNNPTFFWKRERDGVVFSSSALRLIEGRPFEFKLLFRNGDYYFSDGGAAFDYLCGKKPMRQEAALKIVGEAAKKHGLILSGHALEACANFPTALSDVVKLYLTVNQLVCLANR